MNLLARLRELFGPALPEGADRAAFAAAVRPATDPKFGDYQANGCMALAKASARNPATSPRRSPTASTLPRSPARPKSPAPVS